MDLSTVQSKLTDERYDSADEFVADVRLIFTNCSAYYSMPTSAQRTAGDKLSRHFERRLKDLQLIASPPANTSKTSRSGTAKRPTNRSSR